GSRPDANGHPDAARSAASRWDGRGPRATAPGAAAVPAGMPSSAAGRQRGRRPRGSGLPRALAAWDTTSAKRRPGLGARDVFEPVARLAAERGADHDLEMRGLAPVVERRVHDSVVEIDRVA